MSTREMQSGESAIPTIDFATFEDGAPSREAYPRLASYWSALPRGWESHPECLVRDALVDVFRDRGVFDDLTLLPPPIERAARVAPVDGWLPEVIYAGLFLATQDAHFYDASDHLFEDWWLHVGRERVDHGPLVQAAAEDPAEGLRYATALWQSNHRGTEIECASIAPNQAELRLIHPAGLFPPTMLDVYARSIAVFLTRGGAAVPVVHAKASATEHDGGEWSSTFVAEWV